MATVFDKIMEFGNDALDYVTLREQRKLAQTTNKTERTEPDPAAPVDTTPGTNLIPSQYMPVVIGAGVLFAGLIVFLAVRK